MRTLIISSLFFACTVMAQAPEVRTTVEVKITTTDSNTGARLKRAIEHAMHSEGLILNNGRVSTAYDSSPQRKAVVTDETTWGEPR